MGETLFTRMSRIAAQGKVDLRDRHDAPSPFEDIGPQGPNRVALYRKSREVQELAKMAEEYATPGPRLDLARCERTLDRIRHVLGVAGNG